MRISDHRRRAGELRAVDGSRTGRQTSDGRRQAHPPKKALWYYADPLAERDDLVHLRPPVYDRWGRNNGFETPADCQERNALNIAVLGKGGVHSQALGTLIDSCGRRRPCGSPACKVCMREWRRAITGQALPAARRLEREGLVPVFVTLVFTAPELRKPILPAGSFKNITQRVRMTIRRSGLAGVPMLGGLEVDWNEDTSVWDVHMHMVAFVDDKDDLDPLRAHFKKANGVSRPIQAHDVKHLERAISYCWKFAPMRKVRYQGDDGKAHTRKLRLRDARLREALMWLDAHKPEDFFYSQGGLKLTGGKLSSR